MFVVKYIPSEIKSLHFNLIAYKKFTFEEGKVFERNHSPTIPNPLFPKISQRNRTIDRILKNKQDQLYSKRNSSTRCTVWKKVHIWCFLFCILPHLDSIRRSLHMNCKCGNIRTRKTPNTDTFHVVVIWIKESAASI